MKNIKEWWGNVKVTVAWKFFHILKEYLHFMLLRHVKIGGKVLTDDEYVSAEVANKNR